MASYRIVTPKKSVAIIITSVLIVMSFVGCDTEATNPPEVNSVNSADDESAEKPTQTGGDSSDRNDSNSASEEIAEGSKKEERLAEDDEEPLSVLEVMEEESIDIEAKLVDQINEINVDNLPFDTDVDDGATENPTLSNTRCPPDTRCADNGVDRDGMSLTLHFSTPEVDGALATDVVQGVIRPRSEGQFPRCFEKMGLEDPKLDGQITLRWVISPTGEVVNSNVVKSTLDNRTVENCLRRHIFGWKFPKPDGDGVVRVHYSFEFTVEG